MEKKNSFVTAVGFKKNALDHVYMAELLNSKEWETPVYCKSSDVISGHAGKR